MYAADCECIKDKEFVKWFQGTRLPWHQMGLVYQGWKGRKAFEAGTAKGEDVDSDE